MSVSHGTLKKRKARADEALAQGSEDCGEKRVKLGARQCVATGTGQDSEVPSVSPHLSTNQYPNGESTHRSVKYIKR